MEIDGKPSVVRLGERMPLASRRVVRFLGETAEYRTPIGLVDGLADGVVLVRPTLPSYELTPTEAREVAQALTRSALAVEQWQEHASGFNLVRVYRSPEGHVEVAWRGRRRPMRLSKLRGSRRGGFWRPCTACRDRPPELWVAADEVREHGTIVHHAEVCQACVDRLANAPEPRAAAVER